MARIDVLRAEGVVIEVLPDWKFRVELPNGHRLIGFLIGKEKVKMGDIKLGDTVGLEMTPYDLSKGRIVLKKD